MSSPPLPAPDRWQAWDRLLAATPETGFMQSSWWAEFRTTAGFEHFGVMLKNGGAILGGAVVLKFAYADDRCFYYVPEGPVLPADEAVAGAVFDATLAAIEARATAEASAAKAGSTAGSAVKGFVVTTEIDNRSGLLKPGMTGLAKVVGGERRVVDLVKRRLTHTFKVEFWSWW